MFLNLPQDIISNILLRVPTRSLTQIKIVCKLWFDLISDSVFAHAHLERHQDPHIIIDFLQLQDWFKGGQFLLKASWDGLLLLQSKADENQLYVCNPITQNCKKLPCLGEQYPVWEIWDWVLVRDGASVDYAYKVVGVSRDSCSVFKIGRRDYDWKEINTPYQKDSLRLSEHPSLVNKELHWLIRRNQGNGSKIHYETYIYSMNAAAEEIRFRETEVSPTITCVYNFPNCSYLQRNIIIIHYKNRVLAYDLESKHCRRIDHFPDERNVRTRFQFVHMDSLVNWD